MMGELLVPKPRMPWRHLLAFGWMPNSMKLWFYRHLLGYQIGKGVRFGFGGVVVGSEVKIGEFVEVGFLTIIRGSQISIGRHTQIGSTSYLMCETIEIGEDAKINEQVFVGGPMLPESRFQLGSRTIVMQMSFLNPTKPLVIGDDTGIGGHCLIFTHGSWLNVLDGYPVAFEEVTLGKSVWLPWRVFVMPGARIGDGSVIGANSLVQGVIPPSSLAVGAPAKVIRSAPDFPQRLSEKERHDLVDAIMSEFDRYVRTAGIQTVVPGEYRRGNQCFHLHRILDEGDVPRDLDRLMVVLSERSLGTEIRSRLRAAGVSWLDLAGRTRSRFGNPLCEELALFLSRYGIRLERDA
jgi:acetyltransferase-like isoleucine patch superfamily enzyme